MRQQKVGGAAPGQIHICKLLVHIGPYGSEAYLRYGTPVHVDGGQRERDRFSTPWRCECITDAARRNKKFRRISMQLRRA